MKSFKEFNEGLSFSGRKKLARKAKQQKSKLKVARKRAAKKTAPMQKIMQRAQRRARSRVVSHLTGGKGKSGMSFAKKASIEKQVDRRAALVKTFARKEIPKARKDDRKRK